MTALTPEGLTDRLSVELAWRKKELSFIKGRIQRDRGTAAGEALLRAGVALLYAHWEGFVKAAANGYVEYIAARRLSYRVVAVNFLAVDLRKRLLEAAKKNNPDDLIRIVDEIRTGGDQKCRLNMSFDEIGNLDSSALEMIINSLGLDFGPFATRRHLIDEALVRRRNRIAHGQYQIVTFETFLDTFEAVIEMIEDIRNQIEEAVGRGAYRKDTAIAV